MSFNGNDAQLTAIVSFNCESEQQQNLCDKIQAYITNFISQQDGFISANLHKSQCGKKVVNYAQWQSMAHFKIFAEKARSRPELPELLQYKPEAVFYDVVFSAEC
jgi:hypothetical protein